ncbi:carbohydrate ABC transporter permease [Micrococcales bacterium 31B]|nr:carbohydrate ABC transporter permease [Micrococcales bacterium 31B]
MATASTIPDAARAGSARPARTSGRGRLGRPRYGTHVFLLVMALMCLAPMLWTLYTSLRSNVDTTTYGYFSVGGTLSFENYATAWSQGGFVTAITNSALITIPSVLLTIGLASMVAFAVSRFSWRFNVALLIMFTAGNLLPPQILAGPVFKLFQAIQLPLTMSDSGSLLNTYWAVIAMNTAFQMGFCTFVLSNFMKALPSDLTEAALVDGASVWRQYWQIIMPLCRPAIAALATLQVIWVYNDYFWALLLISRGDRLPATTAINNLMGQFTTNYNLLAAGAMITVIPTLLIYLALQRHFVAGLTLGSSKG